MLRGWPRSISMSPIAGGALCGGEARKIGRRWNGSCGWSRIGSRNRASSIPGQMHASPSDTRGGSRMLELGTYGSGAARLAAISAGESRQQRSPVAVVVISSNGEGDRSVGSLEVKALGGRAHRSDPYKGGEQLGRP